MENITGKIRAVCVSEKRGTEKINQKKGLLIENYGLKKDAHAGEWHRQVSLLSFEKVEEFNKKGGAAKEGAFGENLLVDGIDFASLPVGTRFIVGDAVLQMTQIGKKCHSHCEIFKRVGDCIMPREGVFARVIRGGEVKEGDELRVLLPDASQPLTAAVITMSDKASSGERTDTSGPRAKEILEKAGYVVEEYVILPDEKEELKSELLYLTDKRQIALIVTTGGTGFSERDITPEATMEIAKRNAPGIAEAIRAQSMQYTKKAMLGRGVSVIRDRSLIVNLPGSKKAVEESLSVCLDSLEHGIRILQGTDAECGRS